MIQLSCPRQRRPACTAYLTTLALAHALLYALLGRRNHQDWARRGAYHALCHTAE
jgi:hypothetical protein